MDRSLEKVVCKMSMEIKHAMKMADTSANMRGEDRREENDRWEKQSQVISCLLDSIMESRQEVDLFVQPGRK